MADDILEAFSTGDSAVALAAIDAQKKVAAAESAVASLAEGVDTKAQAVEAARRQVADNAAAVEVTRGEVAGNAAAVAAAAPVVVAAKDTAVSAKDTVLAAAANVAASVANAAPSYSTWSALSASTPAPNSIAVLINADGAHPRGQYRYVSGVWTWESDTLPGVAERARVLETRVAREDTGALPRTNDDLEVAWTEDGRILERRTATRGWEVAARGALRPVGATLDGLLKRAEAEDAEAIRLPRIGDYTEVTWDSTGKIVRASDSQGSYVGNGSKLVSVPAEINAVLGRLSALSNDIPMALPRIGDLTLACWDPVSRALAWGLADDGQFYWRDQYGTLRKGVEATRSPRITFRAGRGVATLGPNDVAIVGAHGQSYGLHPSYDYLTATATHGNILPIPGCWMPNIGVNVTSGSPITSLVPMRSLSTLAVPVAAGELPIIETCRALRDEWRAQGLTDLPQIVGLVGGAGGTTTQDLMRGTSFYKTTMTALASVVELVRAQGKRPVIVALEYLQGEAERANVFYASRTSRAMLLARLQADFEADARALTGQTEAVPLVTMAISRTNRPANVALAAIDAMLANPDRIICAGANGGILHAADAHPSLVGARQIGRICGRAIGRGGLGNTYRPVLVRRAWMASATEMRAEVSRPFAGTGLGNIVIDTSGWPVSMTGMDTGLGWTAWDRAGQAAISSVAVGATAHPAGTDDATISINFTREVHENSARAYYANSSSGIGGGLGGSLDGPRGCFRADVPIATPTDEGLPGMPDVFDWLLPAEV